MGEERNYLEDLTVPIQGAKYFLKDEEATSSNSHPMINNMSNTTQIYYPRMEFNEISHIHLSDDTQLVTGLKSKKQQDPTPAQSSKAPPNDTEDDYTFNTFSSYLHVPNISVNYFNQNRFSPPNEFPALTYHGTIAMDNYIFSMGGLRSVYSIKDNFPEEYRAAKVPHDVDLNDLIIHFPYTFPSPISKNILTNPLLTPNKNVFVVNAANLSVKEPTKLTGDVPPPILFLSSCVISPRHAFFYGGFILVTERARYDESRKKWIIYKRIAMNEYGYILDTRSSRFIKVNLKSKIASKVFPGRFGCCLIGNSFDFENFAKDDERSNLDKTTSPILENYSPGHYRTFSSGSDSSSFSNSKSFVKRGTSTKHYARSSPVPSLFDLNPLTSSFEGTQTNSPQAQRFSSLNEHERSRGSSPLSVPNSRTQTPSPKASSPDFSNYGSIDESISKKKETEMHLDSGLDLFKTEANVVLFSFGGLILEHDPEDNSRFVFVASDELLKFELVISYSKLKGRKLFSFANEALITSCNEALSTMDGMETIWPQPRGFYGSVVRSDSFLRPLSGSSDHIVNVKPPVSNPLEYYMNKVLVLHGGVNSYDDVLSSTFVFDFNSGKWIFLDSYINESSKSGEAQPKRAKIPLSFHELFSLGERILFYGGVSDLEMSSMKIDSVNSTQSNHNESEEDYVNINLYRLHKQRVFRENNSKLVPNPHGNEMTYLNMATQTFTFSKYYNKMRRYIDPEHMSSTFPFKILSSATIRIIGGSCVFNDAQLLVLGGQTVIFSQKLDDEDEDVQEYHESRIVHLKNMNILSGAILKYHFPLLHLSEDLFNPSNRKG